MDQTSFNALSRTLRTVFSVLTKKTKVWDTKFEQERHELNYEYKYDGFVFLVTVYRSVKEDGRHIVEIHMSNDGFMFASSDISLVFEHHTISENWVQVKKNNVSFFDQELQAFFNRFNWDASDIKIEAYCNNINKRFDIVCINDKTNWEVSFCFESRYPKYDPALNPPETRYSEIQNTTPATYWGKK